MIKIEVNNKENKMCIEAQGGGAELIAELSTACCEFLGKLAADDKHRFAVYKATFLSAMEKFAVFEEKEEKRDANDRDGDARLV